MRSPVGARLPFRLLTLLLLAVLVLLTPVAYATPPDPVWVSGFFDDDDNDNGAFLVTSSTATLDAFPLCCWAPFPLRWPAPAVEDRSEVPTPSVVAADARASPRS